MPEANDRTQAFISLSFSVFLARICTKKKIKNVDRLLWFTRFRQDVTRFTQPFLTGEEAAAEGESEAAAEERRRDGGIERKEDFWGLREQREKGIWVAG